MSFKMHRFLVVFERAEKNWSAYSPDLPGCAATGATRDDAQRNMHEAISMHVRGMREDGLEVPEAHSFAEVMAIESFDR